MIEYIQKQDPYTNTLQETQIRSKNTQVENEEDGQWYFTQMDIKRKPGSSTYTEQTLK